METTSRPGPDGNSVEGARCTEIPVMCDSPPTKGGEGRSVGAELAGGNGAAAAYRSGAPAVAVGLAGLTGSAAAVEGAGEGRSVRPGALLCGHSRRSVSWLSSGTGFCSNCAAARAGAAMKTPEARAWLRSWERRCIAVREANKPPVEPRQPRRDVPWGEVQRLVERIFEPEAPGVGAAGPHAGHTPAQPPVRAGRDRAGWPQRDDLPPA